MTRRPSVWPSLSPERAREAQEHYEERAAILEYQAEMPRDEAEQFALELTGRWYGTRGVLGRAS